MSLWWKKNITFELISNQNAPCFSRSGASLSLINNALISVSYWETRWCSTPLGAHYLNNHFKCIWWCTWQHTAVEIQHCSSMDGSGRPRCLSGGISDCVNFSSGFSQGSLMKIHRPAASPPSISHCSHTVTLATGEDIPSLRFHIDSLQGALVFQMQFKGLGPWLSRKRFY